MKRRFFTAVFAVVMAISLAACGSSEVQQAQEDTDSPKTETVNESSDDSSTNSENSEKHEGSLKDIEAELARLEEESAKEREEREKENTVDGINYREFYNGVPITQVITEQATYDTLKVIVTSGYGAGAGAQETVEMTLSDGDSLTMDSEKGIYALYYYAPQKVTHLEKVEPNKEYFFDMSDYSDNKVVAAGTVKGKAENAPFGIKVTYEDGTEDSITIYVTKDY